MKKTENENEGETFKDIVGGLKKEGLEDSIEFYKGILHSLKEHIKNLEKAINEKDLDKITFIMEGVYADFGIAKEWKEPEFDDKLRLKNIEKQNQKF